MNKQCILHIGLHKTGSTSIQNSLYSEKFNKTYSYLNLDSANHSVRLYSLFVEQPDTYYWHIRNGLTSDQVKAFNEETKNLLNESIKSNELEKTIISGEDISVLTEFSVYKLKEFLNDYFDDILVIAYIRSPYSYIQSSFQEGIKAGYNSFKLGQLYANYRSRIEKFDTVFGQENVKLYEFNPKLFYKNDIVKDFCQNINISISQNHIIKANKSLSAQASKLLYTYYKFGPGYGVGAHVQMENLLLINKISSIEGLKFKFSPDLIRPIIEFHTKDVQWIEKRLGSSFHDNMKSTPDDICSESDMLDIDIDSLECLNNLVGSGSKIKISQNMPIEDVAMLVHELRLKLVKEHVL